MKTGKRSAPVPPPRVRGSASQSLGANIQDVHSALPLSPADVGGGEETKAPDVSRASMFERLQQYYLKWEGERVHQGIGHIVDWAMQYGEEALNERLHTKYGESLVEFERTIASLKNRNRKDNPPESFMSGNSSSSWENTVRDRLLAFYEKFDKSRRSKGVDDLVDYVARKGLPALNKKLVSKYGLTLEEFEEGVSPQAKERKPKSDRLSMRSLLRRSLRMESATNLLPGKLPPYVRPLLELYYTKYDQSKINSGGVNAIYRWSEKHGLRKLNDQLKAKYLEDLDEFADRMGRLRQDLVEFYSIHEPSKLESNAIDRILRWGVRNGRAAINKQLRLKYKCDLEEKDPSKIIDEEPEF